MSNPRRREQSSSVRSCAQLRKISKWSRSRWKDKLMLIVKDDLRAHCANIVWYDFLADKESSFTQDPDVVRPDLPSIPPDFLPSTIRDALKLIGYPSRLAKVRSVPPKTSISCGHGAVYRRRKAYDRMVEKLVHSSRILLWCNRCERPVIAKKANARHKCGEVPEPVTPNDSRLVQYYSLKDKETEELPDERTYTI